MPETLIAALSRPGAYPYEVSSELAGGAAEIDVVQTHISIIFLVGDRAYKVKKPVDLGFLDFTSLDARRHFCEEEVRLNRRLTRDVYLGIVKILKCEDGEIIVSEAISGGDESRQNDPGEVIDYAVLMQRLPQEAMMDRRLARGEIDNDILDRLAGMLVLFHAACPTGTGVVEHAEPEELRNQVRDNFSELGSSCNSGDGGGGEGRVDGVISPGILDFVRCNLLALIDRHEPLLRTRIAGGRIREGHGDLHSRNICVLDEHNRTPNEIVIYDCIEFSHALRCRDVACEIAFLAMDLDFNGYRAFASHFVREYAARANDPEIHDLIAFYKMHFAVVRSKVEALRSCEQEVNDEDRRTARAAARRYSCLAAGYALQPCLILMCGLPASGKSHVARSLESPLGARILRSDVIRKELAGMSPTDRGRSGDESGLYSHDMTERTYAEMLSRATQELERGKSVICDATFPVSLFRAPFMRIADEHHARAFLIETTAPESAVKERMADRASDAAEASDADWSVYLHARERFEPPIEIDPSHRIRIDTCERDNRGDDDGATAMVASIIDRLIAATPGS